MKTIILGLIAFSSLTAHANVMGDPDKNAVLDEVVASLGRHPLNCKDTVKADSESFRLIIFNA